MRNNKGLGRFETIIVILLLLIVFAFLFKVLIDSLGGEDFNAMRSDAAAFGKAVSTNANFYHDSAKVSLGEAIGEKTIAKIKSPVSKGYCDEAESEVVQEEGNYLVTLRCGNYLIEKVSLTALEDAKIYEVGEWQEKAFEGAEKQTLYNCEDNGQEAFPEYTKEIYYVYKVNDTYGSSHFDALGTNSTCKLLKKDMYRTKKEVEEKTKK